MDCSTFQTELAVSITDGSHTENRTALAEHAAGCLACGRMLHEWDEAQRSLDSALGSRKGDPRRLQLLVEKLYGEKFGSTVDLKLGVTSALGIGSVWPFLIGAAAGLLVGFIAWGGPGSTQQLWLQQVLTGQVGVGPGGRGGWPLMGPRGALWAGLGNLVQDLFGMALMLWLARTRIWDQIFPVSLPRGIYLARPLAALLVVLGICQITLSLLFGLFSILAPSTGIFSNQTFAYVLYAGPLLEIVWGYGFWPVLFLFLFTMFEHLALHSLRRAKASDE